MTIFSGAVLSAVLARSPIRNRQLISASVLLVVSLPFAVQALHRLLLTAQSDGVAIADSPLGYILGAIVEAVLFVPPAVLSLSVWRRRSKPHEHPDDAVTAQSSAMR